MNVVLQARSSNKQINKRRKKWKDEQSALQISDAGAVLLRSSCHRNLWNYIFIFLLQKSFQSVGGRRDFWVEAISSAINLI